MRFLRRAINRARLEQAWLTAQAEQRHANAVNHADRATTQRLTDGTSSPVDALEGGPGTPEPPEASHAPKWRTP